MPGARSTRSAVAAPRWAARAARVVSCAVASAVACAVLLAGCEPGTPLDPDLPASPMPTTSAPGSAVPESPGAGGSPDVAGFPTGDRRVLAGAPGVTAAVNVVATGLPAPWAVAPLPGGLLLVTLRDEARLVVVDPATGSVTPVTGAGADELREQTRPQGEGGLLGAAVSPEDGDDRAVVVFLYRTGEDANAVVRAELTLGAGGPGLGGLTTVLDGIPKAGNHDGGRLKIGPDGFLYVTTGDAGDRPAAQDRGSLSGKILRITAAGEPAPGNPDPASPVWSLGHRNVQGIAWDAQGRMLASEFGQDTWDELNEIRAGGNYGWPQVEGAGDAPGVVGGPAVVDGFVRPLVVWRTADASPSGLAVAGDAAYLAALRGQRLWRVPLAPDAAAPDASKPAGPNLTGSGPTSMVAVGPPQALLEGEGRLRDVVADADGSLWVLTNNTDGRGDAREGDDRLLHVVMTPD